MMRKSEWHAIAQSFSQLRTRNGIDPTTWQECLATIETTIAAQSPSFGRDDIKAFRAIAHGEKQAATGQDFK